MTPLEEQVEKLARTIEHEIRTIETEGLIHVAGPDDTPPRMNIREASGRLARACVSALLPLEVTDEMVEAGAKALGEWGGSAMAWDQRMSRELSRACLSAALTQPQTEQWHENDEADKAATAAGVADADLVRVGDFFGIPAFTHPDVKPGIVGIVSAGEVTATITGTAPQTPEAPLKTSPDDWTHLDSVPDPNKVSVELTREEAEALRELLDPFDLTPESEPGIIDSKLRSALGEGEK